MAVGLEVSCLPAVVTLDRFGKVSSGNPDSLLIPDLFLLVDVEFQASVLLVAIFFAVLANWCI